MSVKKVDIRSVIDIGCIGHPRTAWCDFVDANGLDLLLKYGEKL